MDGSDATQGEAGDRILLETTAENISKIQLESTNRIVSEGQIPIESWTLNSITSPIGGQRIVRSTEISTRITGEISLEDATNSGSDGMLMQEDETTNVLTHGDNFDLEGATGITV